VNSPAVSIVIPTYNRAQPLRACLDALRQQTQPADTFEVIVVMDGATDDTQSLLSGMQQPYSLRSVWQPNAGAGAARNHGARLAQANWLVFLDDDMLPAAGLLAAFLQAAHTRGPALLLGQIVLQSAPGSDWYAQEFSREWAEHYAVLNSGQLAPTWQDCYAGNLAVPRAELQRAGGWPEDLPRNEDLEMGYRLEKLGVPLVYVPAALATQAQVKGFKPLIRDVGRTGPASVLMVKRHPELLASQLGRFGDTTQVDIALRHILLMLNVPLAPLDWIGRLLGGGEQRWRWYRFVYTYAYWRSVRPAVPAEEWRRLTSGTVILMYHAFAQPGEPATHYTLPVARFARQLAWLKLWGYHLIGLEEYVSYRQQNRLPPPRSVVITIDDGYADSYTQALPILRRYHVPATIFLVSQFIGQTNEWDRNRNSELIGRPLLTREQILEMHAAGLSFGVHTRTHRALTGLPAGEQQAEVVGAREELEQMLGFPLTVFSYPYGAADDATRAMVRQAGYAGAVGVLSRKNYASSPLVELYRVNIKGYYRLLDFITSIWVGDHR
jgi:peptidoglycan/xylan/chitin deacetylase (PgdA/CDA1 family)/glycosyltransferase involved in cell wall biosynthesis